MTIEQAQAEMKILGEYMPDEALLTEQAKLIVRYTFLKGWVKGYNANKRPLPHDPPYTPSDAARILDGDTL